MKTLVTVNADVNGLEDGDTGYIDGYVQDYHYDDTWCIVVVTSTTPQKIGTARISQLTPTGILNTVSLS